MIPGSEATACQRPAAPDPAPAPRLRGHLHLEARARPDGRTILARQSFRAPFHISKPHWNGHTLHVQVINPTAGILSGDSLEMRVHATDRAALSVTTPAVTRAFTMLDGTARSSQSLHVAAGAFLDFYPEPLCPHRDTSFLQKTTIHCARGAQLVFLDALAPGRAGRGELWAWRRLQLALDVHLDGRPVLVERLDAAGGKLAAAARFFQTPSAWLASLIAVSPRISSIDTLAAAITSLHGDGIRLGLTALDPDLLAIRLAARDGQTLRDTVAAIRQHLASAIPHLRADLRKL
ncbi:MAG: urease accessory protein UreD [Verrucomicrobia bacterium]|nr:MAG: urease accessory protein UreD [Verrucomicrobiota bacterium]